MPAPAIPGSSRHAALQPTPANASLPEVRELQSRGKTLTSLMRGEPGLPTRPHIAEACSHQHGVVAVHGAVYGPGGEGALRISCDHIAESGA